jgi:hypothetical protein
MKQSAIVPLVAGLLIHTVSSTARASEAQASLQIGGGPLFAAGLEELSVSGLGVIGIGATWPLSSSWRLGVRQEFAVTAIPYGN